MNYRDIARAQLKVDEGEKLKPYHCTAGALTIGVGRNLDAKGIRPDESALMLENDIRDAEADARYLFKGFDFLSENRKAVLLNMSFNLGRDRLSGFQRFISAVGQGNYSGAAKEMEDSAWFRQVGDRAKRLQKQMREG